MAPTQRIKKYVDSTVQAALVKRIVIHWLVFAGVVSLIAFMMQYFSDPTLSLSTHLQELWWTHGFVLVVMLALLPVFAFDSIKLSHRFAGPIHRLKRTIQALANGESFEPMTFRGADYWRSLADDFNRMVERFRREDHPSQS